MILSTFSTLFLPAVLLAGIGGLFGVLIGVLSKVFAVKVDPRLEEVTKMLPGYNCGSCGYPGCSGLATQLVAGKASSTLCKPGKQEMRDRIKAYLEEAEKNLGSEK